MEKFSHIDNVATNELQKAVSNGDIRAFKKLFDMYAERLSHFAYSITRNRDDAVQIMDDVFVKLWKRRDTIHQIENLTTYLYTAVKNTTLNTISAKAKASITESFDNIDIQLDNNQTPDSLLISSEILSKIHNTVETLPPKCKVIFKLVREDGLKYKEVAEILNISENTVDAQMVIAIRKISEKVKRHFDFFPKKQKKV